MSASKGYNEMKRKIALILENDSYFLDRFFPFVDSLGLKEHDSIELRQRQGQFNDRKICSYQLISECIDKCIGKFGSEWEQRFLDKLKENEIVGAWEKIQEIILENIICTASNNLDEVTKNDEETDRLYFSPESEFESPLLNYSRPDENELKTDENESPSRSPHIFRNVTILAVTALVVFVVIAIVCIIIGNSRDDKVSFQPIKEPVLILPSTTDGIASPTFQNKTNLESCVVERGNQESDLLDYNNLPSLKLDWSKKIIHLCHDSFLEFHINTWAIPNPSVPAFLCSEKVVALVLHIDIYPSYVAKLLNVFCNLRSLTFRFKHCDDMKEMPSFQQFPSLRNISFSNVVGCEKYIDVVWRRWQFPNLQNLFLTLTNIDESTAKYVSSSYPNLTVECKNYSSIFGTSSRVYSEISCYHLFPFSKS